MATLTGTIIHSDGSLFTGDVKFRPVPPAVRLVDSDLVTGTEVVQAVVNGVLSTQGDPCALQPGAYSVTIGRGKAFTIAVPDSSADLAIETLITGGTSPIVTVDIGLPPGGTTGQIPIKQSAEPGHVAWGSPSAVTGVEEAPVDGGQYARKDAGWVAVSAGSSGVTSVNTRTGAVTLAAADVGLGNVDNTSDANKPVSSATATALSGKAATSHTHAQSEVTGLESALSGKAATSHTHAQSEVTGLVTALSGKAATSHTHATSEVTGLDTALSGKAPTSHTHATSEVTGLDTALSGKAATSHTHSAADITSGTLGADRLGTGTGLQVVRRNSGNTALEFATISTGGGDMLASNNLSDVVSAATAFANIKQAASTTATGVVELATSGETSAGVVVQGNDSRLSDARTPTSHDHSANKLAQANTHESPDTDTATTSLHHTLGTGANQAAAGNHTHAQLHDAASVTDTDTLDLTVTGQAISGAVRMQMSVTSDASGVKLSGDAATPGNNQVYGTNSSGVKGWKADPAGGVAGVVSLTDAANIATDASAGETFRVTLSGNRTLSNPTNPTNGQRLVWEVIQDGTGGRTLTMDTKFAFGSDITAITLTATASKRDFITAVYNSTADKWYVVGFVRGY